MIVSKEYKPQQSRVIQSKRMLGTVLQRYVTANASVTVPYKGINITETASGISAENYISNRFTNYFLKNIKSMKLEEIAVEDNWPQELIDLKQSQMNNKRDSIHCAEPHAVINALIKISSKNDFDDEDKIGNVTFEISDIKNSIDNQPMYPCAVCKQWITSYKKGTGNGVLGEWIKSPLAGWELQRSK